MNLEIDQDALLANTETLAGFSDAEPPAVTRVVFTARDLQARKWLISQCEASGLKTRVDAIGNIFARWIGSDSTAAAVATGSHIDAIPNAGKYDGVVGVLGGLEAMRALQRSGFQPKKSIELLVFTSEEPTRFGIGCLGSRLLSGALTAEKTAALTDDDGATVDEVRRDAGFSGKLCEVKLALNYYEAFVELHIEQGPLLEKQNVSSGVGSLGIVSRIAAPASLRMVVEGSGGHAGGVLMPERRDALCAAAELILGVESAARSTGDNDSVATVGICDVFPGAVNSIPSRVRLMADVRDTNRARRDELMQSIERTIRKVADTRQVSIESQLINADEPADCDIKVQDALRDSCRELNFPYLSMVSRAYHDSLFMSRIAPTGMLFIPCRNGYSHRPDEYASPEDIARGSLVLAHALARLAQ